MQYTEDQQKVIDLRDRNILVSAAAGSGKTAVLVERIIQKICDEQHPVDIDKMLIVTFTSASAAEMRERISKAIISRLEEDPSNEHLQKQSALIHHALITTIDSFCLFLIRNHFHEIDLDPAFRVADEAEGKLLRKDAMQELLESEYATEDEKFVQFVESYATNGSEKAIEEAIYRLYDFAISYPWPEEWLLERKKDYEVNTVEELEQQKWFQSGMVFLQETLLRCKDRILLAKSLAESVNGPYMYLENLQKDSELLDAALKEKKFEKLGEKLAQPFSRLSTKKDENVDAALKESVKNIRNDVKDQIAALQDIFFPVSVQRTVEDMKKCQLIVTELADLTIRFMEILGEKKKEKNIVDFADMEHFALHILLSKDEDGNYHTTDTAKVYQSYFEEVMIDEYQDSNLVQELLLSSVSGEEIEKYNRFMVGDVKQSIYKFRLARPEIFLEKYGQYTHEDSKRQRIDLSKNFRSRIEVTESVNLICSRLMQKEVGGVSYDQYAALYAGADYEPAEDTRYATEILISTRSEEEDQKKDKMEIEAKTIAAKIKSIVGNLPVRTKEGKYAPASYKDIVILLRSTVGWEGILRRVFAEEGIPLHMSSRSGYFQTTEVITIINFLRVLDNPLQDVALFGVLKSPFFQFSEVEIAKIRAMTSFRKAKLYTFLKAYAQGRIEEVLPEEEIEKITENDAFIFDQELQEKVKSALEQIRTYRKKVSYMPISELIRDILNDSHYEEYILAMQDGEQRKANIDFLLEQASAFEKTSFYGLFHFIRYLEEIREQEVDFGEVNILDENADVVRMMTIHKSKGLEFPVCIVAGLAKQFNQMDSRKNILLDIDMGIGTDYIDPQQRIKRKTLRKNLVKWKMEIDSRGEDLRVLYVALTRAKEKLILSAYDDKIEKTLQSLQMVEEMQQTEIPSYMLLQAQNYEKLILAALMKHPAMKEIKEGETKAFVGCMGSECCQEMYLQKPEQIPLQIQIYQKKEMQEEKVKENMTAYVLQERLNHASAFQDDALKQKIQEKFSFVYPYSALCNLTTKTTVSDLKKRAFHEENEEAKELFAPKEKESYVPAFAALEETKVKGNVRGTLYHKLMELIDYKNMPKNQEQIEDFIKEQSSQGFFEKEYIDLFSIYKIEKFLHSKLAKRMEEAAKKNQLYKEQPFVLGIPADRLSSFYDKEETILIQGVIDAFFEEEDGIVLLDYKTDLVKTQEELIKRYQVQLQYYREAIEAILEKKVKEIYIYSFSLQKEILLT